MVVHGIDGEKNVTVAAGSSVCGPWVHPIESTSHAAPSVFVALPVCPGVLQKAAQTLHMNLLEVIEQYGEDCIVIPEVDFGSIVCAVQNASATATPTYIRRYEEYNNSRKNNGV